MTPSRSRRHPLSLIDEAAIGVLAARAGRRQKRRFPRHNNCVEIWNRRECLSLIGAGLLKAAGDPHLMRQWEAIAAGTDGTLGAAAWRLGSGFQASLHGSERFPLASVCKLPLAMNMLALVDEGQYRIDSPIDVIAADVTRSVSPIGEQWPRRKRWPLEEMLGLMIAQSDNTAVETLYRLGGGSAAMAARFREWKVEGIRIDRTERQCGIDAHASMDRFLADPRDTATPDGTIVLLQRLFHGDLLSKGSTARLIRMMQATTTGPARIKGQMPPGTVVAHKTGTGYTLNGVNGAVNDVGVIDLPRGAGQLAVAFYLKGSRRGEGAREATIARLAKAAFDASA